MTKPIALTEAEKGITAWFEKMFPETHAKNVRIKKMKNRKYKDRRRVKK